MKETSVTEQDREEITVLVIRAQRVIIAAVDEIAGIALEGVKIAEKIKVPIPVVTKVEPECHCISTRELAKRSGISRVTVHRMRKQGMPQLRIGYRALFDYELVTQWVEERNGVRKR